MQELGEAYQAQLEGHVYSRRPVVPFFSTVISKAIVEAAKLDPLYWRTNLESPVLFYGAIKKILSEPTQDHLFVEVGPHSALAGPLRQIFQTTTTEKLPTYIPTLVRDGDGTKSLLTTLGQLHLQAVPIDFAAVTSGRRVLTDLPTYPWRHDRNYWSESRVTREWRMREFPRHELLGARILEGNGLEPTWRNMLRLEDVPWLQDHKIVDDIVFPCAGYVAMVGEAIRQITGTKDFTLRRVTIKTALVMQESKGVEVMTSLRPVRLTITLDSIWYDFSIFSYNGTSWIKHCVGQARAGSEQAPQPRIIEKLARDVAAPAWYQAMKRTGLNYGPSFQGLEAISAHPSRGTAVASLLDRYRPFESAYQLHPTTVDHCLQLLTVAASKGIARNLTTLCVPTTIEELYIHQGSPEMQAEAIASSTPNGTIHGDAIIMADGEVVFHLKGGEFSPLEGSDPTESPDTVAAARLEWKADINFVPAESLIHPYKKVRDSAVKLERLALLCMLETRHRVSSVDTNIDHLKKYRSWLDLQAARAQKGEYVLVHEAKEFANLSQEERLALIESANKDMEQMLGAEISKVLLRIVEYCQAMFEGTFEPIEILLRDDGLQSIYNFYQDMWDCRAYFALHGHAKPNLRILEIGAGTGGTTASVLKDLTAHFGERMYSKYTYTDISAGFFVAAKERFKDYQNIQYAILDISKDPISQGFEAESYDLILASNVNAQPIINALVIVANPIIFRCFMRRLVLARPFGTSENCFILAASSFFKN